MTVCEGVVDVTKEGRKEDEKRRERKGGMKREEGGGGVVDREEDGEQKRCGRWLSIYTVKKEVQGMNCLLLYLTN